MADTLFLIAASGLVGDNDAQLVAGDVAATFETHIGRPAMSFDDTAEEAATSPEYECPESYGGGTLKATLHLSAQATTGGVVMDVFVEAKTPGTDTIDMSDTASWDSANSTGDIDFAGTTAGDPVSATVTLTNKDGMAAGDAVRIGVRRDTDHANDDLSGDVFLYSVRIWEDA